MVQLPKSTRLAFREVEENQGLFNKTPISARPTQELSSQDLAQQLMDDVLIETQPDNYNNVVNRDNITDGYDRLATATIPSTLVSTPPFSTTPVNNDNDSDR